MPKIFVKSSDPSIIPKLSQNRKPGYDLVSLPVNACFDMLSAENTDIHGIVVDSDLITPAEVCAIRTEMDDTMFPIVLLAGELSDEQSARWISAGVSDIFQLPVPAAVMARRLGSVIRLYCVIRSLHAQETDKLTNLFNKNAFYHFAKEMMQRDPEDKYIIILSDIENFKGINERFGEEKGDALLRYVGTVLNTMNNEDVLFARYGGDQFVGILRRPKTDMQVDEKFLDQGMARFYREAPIKHFSVQFGIYEDVDPTLPVSILCDRARMALNTIKHRYGRKIAKYTPQLQRELAREQLILDTMEEGIRENQFQIYYQPKHDVKTSAVVGAEALVRWNHPSLGFLSPGEFIPLFEKSGFITKMDEYDWGIVCNQITLMQKRGIQAVPISVNATRMDFAVPRFVEKLMAPVKACKVDPRLLHLELTESVYMEDADVIAPILEQIKSFGMEIELDDFGSGYSALGILSKLPVDVIKLDITLIRELDTHPAMVESVIRLMHTLGYKVTAEGVEQEQQIELLRKMKCDWIQGYYYSKPLTFEGFCRYLSEHEQIR